MTGRFGRTLLVLVPLVVAVMCGLTGVAWGHAHLREATPAQGATVSLWPEEVRLTFSEPIELQFSTFKVYPLEATGSEAELREAARELLPIALAAKDDDDVRVDTGLATTRSPSAQVTIQVKDEAAPGAYAVVWRALSIDTHVVDGFYVFTYAP